MNHPKRRLLRARFLAVALGGGLLILVGYNFLTPAYGAQLGNRSLQLSRNVISTSSEYQLSFNLATAGPLGSILVQFCSNDPFPGTACVPPGGFNDSSAVLASQTGPTGFSISPTSTANELILTRLPLPEPIGPASYDFSGIINPSSPGSYFVRVQTFATPDASGPASDYGGIAFYINNELSISAEVPPYLVFCTGITIGGFNCANASGDYIDFGELSSKRTGSGSSQMLAATNADGGYNVTVDGTALTSGNNVIAALTNSDVSRPGVAQFGFNLRANAAPSIGNDTTGPGTSTTEPPYSQPNIYRFAPGDSLVVASKPDDVRKYTASYIANVPSSQPPGVYVSTITYICLANF